MVPVGEDDEYKLFACTPNIIVTQHTVAMTLGLPFNKIVVTTKRVGVFLFIIIDSIFFIQIGCNYGGKVGRFIPMTCATALAAKLTGKPVRCQLTR